MPAVVDLAAMRDAMAAARRRSAEDQPARPRPPRHRSQRHGRRVRHAQGVRGQCRARISAQHGALPVPQMGRRARSTISRSSRPAPASATRSISNISRAASGRRPSRRRRRRPPRRRPPPGRARGRGGPARGRPARRRGPPGRDRARRRAEIAYPDTLVGTDSHTTMVNGLGVLGWGVGGIEAEAAMLGQPVSMIIPEVVGFHLTGALKEGITATDLVLTVTQMLRAKGVVGRFVEFFGPGVSALSVADRATIANMAPEYGATCGFFPIDAKTLDYMRLTGRPDQDIALTEAYCRAQGMWFEDGADDPVFTETLRLDMASVEPSLAGPKRPQDKVLLSQVDEEFRTNFTTRIWPSRGRAARALRGRRAQCRRRRARHRPWRRRHRRDHLVHQHLQPLGAGRRRPRRPQGARAGARFQALGQDLARAGHPGRHRLSRPRRALARTSTRSASTWSAMAAPPASAIRGRCPRRSAPSIHKNDLVAASVLSGNRNFEGRVSPDVRANYLASPPLVVAYALKGTVIEDMVDTPIGRSDDGDDVYLKDIWPSNDEIRALIDQYRQRRHVPRPLCRRLQGRRALAEDRGRPAATPMPGRPPRPTSPTRLISRACR